MKKLISTLLVPCAVLFIALSVYASEEGEERHEKKSHIPTDNIRFEDLFMGKDMDHSKYLGLHIRSVQLGQFLLAYHLLDQEMSNKHLGNKHVHYDRDKSHHIMLYIKHISSGMLISLTAKVDMKATGPDGEVQKKVGSSMHGGVGLGVDLKDAGMYKFKVIINLCAKKLIDEFTYEI